MPQSKRLTSKIHKFVRLYFLLVLHLLWLLSCCIIFNVLYPNLLQHLLIITVYLSAAQCRPLHTVSMWTEQSVSRSEPAGCLFMPAELCWFAAVMPARVCRQLRVPSRPSLCQSTLLRPVSQHLWRACSMHYQEPQPYLCLPTGLHWRPVHTVSTHT